MQSSKLFHFCQIDRTTGEGILEPFKTMQITEMLPHAALRVGFLSYVTPAERNTDTCCLSVLSNQTGLYIQGNHISHIWLKLLQLVVIKYPLDMFYHNIRDIQYLEIPHY